MRRGGVDFCNFACLDSLSCPDCHHHHHHLRHLITESMPKNTSKPRRSKTGTEAQPTTAHILTTLTSLASFDGDPSPQQLESIDRGLANFEFLNSEEWTKETQAIETEMDELNIMERKLKISLRKAETAMRSLEQLLVHQIVS